MMVAFMRKTPGVIFRQLLPYIAILLFLNIFFYCGPDVTQLGLLRKLSMPSPDICIPHGMPPYPHQPGKPRKVYDLFMLNTELDWLEIRLNTLANNVDYFVIVESNITFTGNPKPLHYFENRARFSKLSHKIIYHLLENGNFDSSSSAWDKEEHQRNAMFTQVIPRLNGTKAANPGDVIIVSDVDEIPRPKTVDVLRTCDYKGSITLHARFYYYSYQFLHRGVEWAHPQATVYAGPTDTILPADLRYGKGDFPKGNLANASWHCSSCFPTMAEMKIKMASFSHTEYNTDEFKSEERIADRVRKGLDLFDRQGEEYDKLEGNNDVPDWVAKNPEKFGYLLKRDNRNAGFIDYEPKDGGASS
ncbi:hypothetical protein DSL72_005371 [Monilinia vaccinii-corymbosi]|uniref:Glycosyltransferase family 17 protein n=1 Tax=Monilinia vaccinii-corymbosi TaxID=61207 RepID=A0A8A3PFG2_9HELO|nr:hypothetical protein DSL72_005371 [Monilinia vaccinii-corymbosi]